MRIDNKLVLITGASSGIGAALAALLTEKNGTIVLLARRKTVLDTLVNEIKGNGGNAVAFPVDLADPQAVAATAATILKDLGTPDVIVNCAGAGRWLYVHETSAEEAVQMMAVPYFAAFYVTAAFLQGMTERGSGHIVNVGSPASFAVWPGATGYIAARWAMRGFSQALRADLRGTGVNVTFVAPGKVDSEYFASNPGVEERMPKITKWFPTLTPEQVAEAIVKGIERNRREVVIPFAFRLAIGCHRIFPRLVEWLANATGVNRSG